MCVITPAVALAASAALSVGGALYSANETEKANDRRQGIINAAQNEASTLNERKAKSVEKFAEDTFDPAKREGVREDQIQRQESSLVDALMAASDGKIKDANGNISSDYLRAKATSEAGAADDILKRAKLAARNSGASLLYNRESLGGNQLSSDLALLTSQGRRAINAGASDAGRVRDNGSLVAGLLGAAGQGLSAYSSTPKVAAAPVGRGA